LLPVLLTNFHFNHSAISAGRNPIDELFDVAVIAGVRQPRALGLQGEEIECLVKLPETADLVHLRPLAPSAGSSERAKVDIFGLPEAAAELKNANNIN
jgi:hypothetical protein